MFADKQKDLPLSLNDYLQSCSVSTDDKISQLKF
jgi:hypothetical protein